jgi:hypothetical protein
VYSYNEITEIEKMMQSIATYECPSNYIDVSSFVQNLAQQSNTNLITHDNVVTKKPRKFKRYDHLKCVVCGDVSSGFHYGAYTCEACKLFFIRAEKNNREFNKCPNGNCSVNIDKRKSCAACRYKMCIASGMDLNKSKFGRHTIETKANEINNHIPNMNLALTEAYQELHNYINIQLINFNCGSLVKELKMSFTKFYYKCMAILSVNKKQAFNSFLLNDYQRQNEYTLDIMMITVFCVLFDVPVSAHLQNEIINFKFAENFREILKDCRELCDFNLTLKVICLIYVVHFTIELSQNDLLSMLKDNSCKKRLIDLVKAEFSLNKFKDTFIEDVMDDFVVDIDGRKRKRSRFECDKQFKYPDYLVKFNCFTLQLVEIETLINQYLWNY